MKKIKILGFIVMLMMYSISCEELPDPAGQRGTAVVPAITDVNPGIFDSKDLENSYVEFTVIVPPGEQVNKIIVQGSYKDNYERVTITELTTFPATVRIKSADAAQMLGINLEDISNGDVFLFELVTTAKGIVTRSNAVLFVSVACAYDVDLSTGSYHAVSEDWVLDGNITLTPDPGDPYKIYITGLGEAEGLTEDQGPLVMYIDPVLYEVEIPEKLVSSDYYGYGAISYTGYGLFSSCNGSYTLYLDISVGTYGNQGTFGFTFTRNP